MASMKKMKALRRNRKRKIGKAITIMFIALALIGTAVLGSMVTFEHQHEIHIVTYFE